VGVIYYELLFGRRPFGDGMSQQNILANKVIQHATTVAFPPAERGGTAASPEAQVRTTTPVPRRHLCHVLTRRLCMYVCVPVQEFITRCLTHNQRLRPDVAALAESDYLRREPGPRARR
jgi:serine/threonine protein kinase